MQFLTYIDSHVITHGPGRITEFILGLLMVVLKASQ
jgi:hypothetical protein